MKHLFLLRTTKSAAGRWRLGLPFEANGSGASHRSGLVDLVRWLGGDPFVQIGRHAVVNLQAIEHVTHYGDRLYRVQLRNRVGTEITASRTGAARLAAVLKTHR